MSELVERILKVFEEKKLLGRREEWGVEASNGKYVLHPGPYCCGLGALLLGRPVEHDEFGLVLDQESAAVRSLGLSAGYVEGFYNGFDGAEPPKEPTNDFAEGFEDGRSTWNALVKKNRVYISEEEIEREMAEPDYDDSVRKGY